MNIENLHLFRRRFIPDEITPLSDDKVLKLEENLIITSWKTLNPRTDFASGMSAYFIDKGWKVSKFLDCEGNIKYWYCDIIDSIVDEENNSYIRAETLRYSTATKQPKPVKKALSPKSSY